MSYKENGFILPQFDYVYISKLILLEYKFFLSNTRKAPKKESKILSSNSHGGQGTHQNYYNYVSYSIDIVWSRAGRNGSFCCPN